MGSAGFGEKPENPNPAGDVGGGASSGTSAKLKEAELEEVDGWADGLNISKDVC